MSNWTKEIIQTRLIDDYWRYLIGYLCNCTESSSGWNNFKNETRADKEESLKELTNLVKTAGSTPYIVQTKRVDKIDPKTFIGKGSIKELEDISKSNDIDVVIFDCELTPNQQKELRTIFQCDVVDRTGLILDIFSLHAQSKEASLQVELAMSVYLKPRLAGLGKTLNQQGGGIGTRGPVKPN